MKKFINIKSRTKLIFLGLYYILKLGCETTYKFIKFEFLKKRQ